MGLFSKKLSAKDIIEALGALSDEEREQVKAFAFGNDTAQTEEDALPDAADNSQDAEEQNDAAAPAEESAEGPAEDAPADEGAPVAEEATQDAAEEAPSADAPAEGEDAAVPEVKTETPAADTAEESPAQESAERAAADFTAILDRMEKLEETVLALANRIGAQEDKDAEDQDDPFGYAFGPEHKSDSTESDLEKAKREAGFNF